MADLTLTWLGHATFRFDTPGAASGSTSTRS